MFRFTIRDVLWLMVVVGIACGWWSARASVVRLTEQNHGLRDEVQSREADLRQRIDENRENEGELRLENLKLKERIYRGRGVDPDKTR